MAAPTADAGRGPLTEPHIAINPAAGVNAVVGAISPSLDRDGPWHCVAFSSFDGGSSWARRDFDRMERCIDPWVVFPGPDAVLLTALEIRRDSVDEGRFRLVAYRSDDRGRTWAGPDTLGRGFEHPIVLAGGDGADDILLLARRMSRGPAGELLHHIHLGRSTDGGRTFEVASEGRPAGTGPETSEITPTGLARLDGAGLLVTAVEGGRARALRSDDGGRTFPRISPISDGCAGGGEEDEFAGWPFLAADRDRGRVYHTCVRTGFAGLELRYSADGGAAWSEPRVLGVESRVSGVAMAPGPPHARTPMLAVNRDGVVGVAWYDRRLDPARACQDVLFAASTDGGGSFGQPVRVTTETSCPRVEGNGWIGESWASGGDYSSLAAAPDGSFRLVWADSRSGRFALRTAVLKVDAGR